MKLPQILIGKIAIGAVLCPLLFVCVPLVSAQDTGATTTGSTSDFDPFAQNPDGTPVDPTGDGSGTPQPQDVNFESEVRPGMRLEYTTKQADLGPGGFDINPTNMTGVQDFGPKFISFLTGVVILIAILVFMIGGGCFIFSAGNESLIGRGKDMMLYSTGGVLCVLGAYVLTKLFQIALYTLGT